MSVTSGLDSWPGVAAALSCSIFAALVLTFSLTGRHTSKLRLPVALGAGANTVLLSANILFVNRLSDDQLSWHVLGIRAAEYLAGTGEVAVNYVDGKEGYVWILGAIYAFAGPVPLVAILLNILGHLLLILCVGRIAGLLSTSLQLNDQIGHRSMVWASYATALLPSFVFWVPTLLREVLTWLVVATAVMLVLDIVRTNKLSRGLGLLPLLALLYWVRIGIGVALTVGVVGGMLLAWTYRSRFRIFLRIGILALFAVIYPTIWARLTAVLGLDSNTFATATSELATIATSGFPGLSQTASTGQILSVTLPRVALGPFIHEIGLSGVMVLAAIEGLCWLVVLALTIRALVLVRRRVPGHMPAEFQIILVVAMMIVTTLVLSVGNYGILARLRPTALVVLVPVAAIGMGMRAVRSRRREPLVQGHVASRTLELRG